MSSVLPEQSTSPSIAMSSTDTTTGSYETVVTVKPFSKISIPIGKNVILQSSTDPTEHSVKFSCDTNMTGYFSANTDGITLKIVSARNCDTTIRGYEYQSIEVGNVISLTNSNVLNGTQLSIFTSDSARISLNSLLYDGVDVIMFNGGSILLGGSTRVFDVTQLGSGTIDARALKTVFGRVFASNSGLLQINSSNYLSLFISGRGNIVWCASDIDIQTEGVDWSAPPNVTQHCI